MTEEQTARFACACVDLGHTADLTQLMVAYQIAAVIADRVMSELDEQQEADIRRLFGMPDPPEGAGD